MKKIEIKFKNGAMLQARYIVNENDVLHSLSSEPALYLSFSDKKYYTDSSFFFENGIMKNEHGPSMTEIIIDDIDVKIFKSFNEIAELSEGRKIITIGLLEEVLATIKSKAEKEIEKGKRFTFDFLVYPFFNSSIYLKDGSAKEINTTLVIKDLFTLLGKLKKGALKKIKDKEEKGKTFIRIDWDEKREEAPYWQKTHKIYYEEGKLTEKVITFNGRLHCETEPSHTLYDKGIIVIEDWYLEGKRVDTLIR